MMTNTQSAIQERAKYVKAWNETMVKIWQERIMQLGVFESPRRHWREGEPHLYDSLRLFPVAADDRYMEITVSHAFLQYGIYQDFGVGREKFRGNPGDIGTTTKAGNERKIRERRRWFSIKYYASCMNIKDYMADSLGREFTGIISDIFEQTNKYN